MCNQRRFSSFFPIMYVSGWVGGTQTLEGRHLRLEGTMIQAAIQLLVCVLVTVSLLYSKASSLNATLLTTLKD